MNSLENLKQVFGEQNFDLNQMKKDFVLLTKSKQKSLMFMLKAGIYGEHNKVDYYTDFSNYENDYVNYSLNTPFYSLYDKLFFYFYTLSELTQKTRPKADELWIKAKNDFFNDLGWNDLEYIPEFEAFIFGLKLKQKRVGLYSIEQFTKKSGLNRYKINLIENTAYKAKLIDIIKYVEEGLGMTFNLGNDHKTRLLCDSINSTLFEDDFIKDSETFLEKLKVFSPKLKKRMFLMIEATYTCDNLNYDLWFYTYERDFHDVRITNEYMPLFTKYMCYLDDSILFTMFPAKSGKKKWDDTKYELVAKSGLSNEIFKRDFECFKLGIRLKNRRYLSKVDFSLTKKISIYKINQIEQYAFDAKLGDLFIYINQGLNTICEFLIENKTVAFSIK